MSNTKLFSKYSAALLTISIVLTGCASTPVSFNSQAYINDQTATVFIYRPDVMANMLVNADIRIDDTRAISLGNNRYQLAQLAAGRHTFKLAMPERYTGQSELTLDTAHGQAYFIRIDTAMKFQQNRPYERSFDMLQVTEAQALPQISLCQPANSTTSKRSSPAAADKTPGYSSQIFRNPFSHQATSD